MLSFPKLWCLDAVGHRIAEHTVLPQQKKEYANLHAKALFYTNLHIIKHMLAQKWRGSMWYNWNWASLSSADLEAGFFLPAFLLISDHVVNSVNAFERKGTSSNRTSALVYNISTALIFCSPTPSPHELNGFFSRTKSILIIGAGC